ncbi:response regulator transcription factor [Blastomonas fulva]|jgi:two-component system response regulator QseB|uniref:response regulator transcription factor n=1 Tax=Blastomonas fulva TaxID=1550728 RepID=UPI003D2AB2CA
MRLLIVEDNERLAGLIAQGLGRRGFSCDIAPDLATADACLDGTAFDAVILDLGLPDGDGMEWLQHQRTLRQLVPALMLTARGGLEDRIAGLDAGADDYLVKPVDIEELAARVRALLRRPGPRVAAILEAGALTFDPVSREARSAGSPIELSRREADLLELLMRRLGTVVVRNTIETTLYSFNEPVTPNAVEATVSRLRRKLDEAGLAGQLHTVRGVGYMLRNS